MADNDRDPPEQQHEGGIEIEAANRRVRIGADEARTLLGYTGGAWRAVVYALAYAVAIIATFFAWSLTQ
jgi:hypothetical protein